jgi:putative ABC transport system permease protein
MRRPLRYTLRTLRRSGWSTVLRSLAVAIAATLAFYVFAQSSTVRDQADALGVGDVGASLLQRATVSLTVIALLVGALQIGVVMTRVVLSRMREIGILKAAGVRSRDIFLVFGFESVIYGLVGGVVGCLAGALIVALSPSPDWGHAVSAAVITIGLSVVVSAVAGVGPALRAMRAPTVEAIGFAW